MTELDYDTGFTLSLAYSTALTWTALIHAIHAGGMTGFAEGIAVAAVVHPALVIIGGLAGYLE